MSTPVPSTEARLRLANEQIDALTSRDRYESSCTDPLEVRLTKRVFTRKTFSTLAKVTSLLNDLWRHIRISAVMDDLQTPMRSQSIIKAYRVFYATLHTGHD